MTPRASVTRAAMVVGIAMGLGVATIAVRAQAPVVPSTSAVKAKELAAGLAQRKMEYFAVSDPATTGRYVAVLHVPGVQLLVVSAAYERITDMDYRFYHKDYQNVYLDLRSGLLSKDRTIVEDATGDGLIAIPGKSLAHDAITIGTASHTFDGDFADPKKKNQKKISQEDYLKAFTDADERYAKLLGLLLEGLGKI